MLTIKCKKLMDFGIDFITNPLVFTILTTVYSYYQAYSHILDSGLYNMIQVDMNGLLLAYLCIHCDTLYNSQKFENDTRLILYNVVNMVIGVTIVSDFIFWNQVALGFALVIAGFWYDNPKFVQLIQVLNNQEMQFVGQIEVTALQNWVAKIILNSCNPIINDVSTVISFIKWCLNKFKNHIARRRVK